MKTYNSFIIEVYSDDEAAKIAPGIDPAKRKARLDKARSRNYNNNATTPGKALPGGSNKIVPVATGPSTGGGQKQAVGKSTADNTARKRVIDNPQGKEEYDKTDTNNSSQTDDKKNEGEKSTWYQRNVRDRVNKAKDKIANNPVAKNVGQASSDVNKGRKKFGQFYRDTMKKAQKQGPKPQAMDGSANVGASTHIERG